MPTFEYTAFNATGGRVNGVLAGASEQAVLAELESRQLTPVSLEVQAQPHGTGGKLKLRPLGSAYSQIADLLRAGVPLLRALRLIAGRKSQPRLADAFRELADAVAAGEDLGSAMSRRPDCFPSVQVAMVRAGERGGFLEAVLARLGNLVTAQADLKSKILGSLAYPAVLVFAGAGIISGIFIFLVPKFKDIIANIKGGVPLITRLVFGASEILRTWWPLFLVLLAVAIIAVVAVVKQPRWRRRFDAWRTRVWVIGSLTRAMAAARFCRMLGTMLGNGVPMLTAMQISKDAAGNIVMEEAIDRATEAVRAGQPLAAPLAESGLFDDDVIEMISVGEAANNLDDILNTIADSIDQRVDRLLTGALKLVEPLLLLVIGAFVFVIAIALIIPIMKLRGGM